MKSMKYVNKAAKRCIDAIKINIEHRLKRVHELQSEYLSGLGNNSPEVYAEKTKYELTCITESMLWIRRYIPEFDSYTSKDGVVQSNLILMIRIILLQLILKAGHIIGNHFHH